MMQRLAWLVLVLDHFQALWHTVNAQVPAFSVRPTHPITGPGPWKYETGGNVDTTPAFDASGNVFIGSKDGYLYKINGNTGENIWSYDTGGAISMSPAVDASGNVFVVGNFTKLNLDKIDGKTGAVIWSYEPKYGDGDPGYGSGYDGGGLTGYGFGSLIPPDLVQQVTTSPVIDAKGNVLVVDIQGNLVKINGATGLLLSRMVTQVRSLPVIDPFGNIVIWLSKLPYSWARRPHVVKMSSTGEYIWSLPLNAAVMSTPAVDSSGNVFIAHSIVKDDDPIDPYSHTLYYNPGRMNNSTRDEMKRQDAYGASHGFYSHDKYDEYYTGTFDRHFLKKIDAKSGEVIWSSEMDGPCANSLLAIDASGHVFVRTESGSLYKYNGKTGALMWSCNDLDKNAMPHGSEYGSEGSAYGSEYGSEYVSTQDMQSSPAIDASGNIFVGSEYGSLYYIDGKTGAVIWTYLTGGHVRSSPRMDASGKVFFFGSQDGFLHKISLVPGHQYSGPWPAFNVRRTDVVSTGPITWKYQTAGSVDSSPALDALGNILVGSDDKYLYKLNGANGALLWRYETGGAVDSSPAIDACGDVFVGSDDSYLYKIHGKTGALIWRFNTGNHVNSSPAIDARGDVFVGSNFNRLSKVNGTTGELIWYARTEGDVVSSPAIDHLGDIFVGSQDAYLYKINGETGSEIWKFQTGGSVYSSPAIDASGHVVVGSHDKYLYKLNGETGALVWKFQTSGIVESSPAMDASGDLFVGSNDKYLYKINGATGKLVWRYKTGSFVKSSPVIDAFGDAIVGSQDKSIYKINGKTAKLLWRYKTGGTVYASPTIDALGAVFVGSQDKKLYKINGKTGK